MSRAATEVGLPARSGSPRPAVRLTALRKSYGHVLAVDGVDLEIAEGEFFTMLGPSGSGKTTLLRIIAGFERPDSGTVELGGTDVTREPPYARDVNTVFQDYALFPHLTVIENVEYGLKIRKVPKAERRSAPIACSTGSAFRPRWPQAPPALRRPAPARRPCPGDRERAGAAPARRAAGCARPQAAPGDADRAQADPARGRDHLFYVTHDQEEALTMSDRLAVMNGGQIEQIGTPIEVYERPATEFVAGFIGISNLIDRDGHRLTVRPEKVHLLLDDAEPAPRAPMSSRGRRRGALPRRCHALRCQARRGRRARRGKPELGDGRGRRARGARPARPGGMASGSVVPDRDCERSLQAAEIDVVETEKGGDMSYMAKFRRRNHRAVLVVALALPVVLAGWVSGASATPGSAAGIAGARLTPPTQGMKPQQSIGKGEGQLNLIAWEGYTQAQWVKPFEKQTGCTVNAKYAGSSSEMVSLMANGGGGQYDLVSASGDADLRLIYGGAVKPVNIKLVPSWKQFRPFLQSPAFNTINGVHYGVSLQFGPNDLLYSTKAFPKAPTSWSVIYSKKYSGKITIPNNPIQIADAALYLSVHQRSSGSPTPTSSPSPSSTRR